MFDAAVPDAAGPCPGEILFTGEYVDWDSTELDFLGIFDATYTELGNKTNTASTAPNGRVELCVAQATDAVFSIAHATYLDAVYTMSAEVNAAGPFSIRGLTPARADTLLADPLPTRDVGDAQVIVAVRTYPEGTPTIGAQVSLGNAHEGAFTSDANADYVSGDTTTDDAFVLFANTVVGGGQTSVTVVPPAATTCVGPSDIAVNAGELAFATFACAPE